MFQLDIAHKVETFKLKDIPHKLSSLEDIEDLRELLSLQYGGEYNILFRGHEDESFKLESTLHRSILSENNDLSNFTKLKKICIKYGYNQYKSDNFDDALYYLSIGRHLGYKCRLIDWTPDLNMAIAFACCEQYENKKQISGTLWVMFVPHEHIEKSNPFRFVDGKLHVLQQDYFCNGEHLIMLLGNNRRYHQHGMFSVISPDQPYEYLPQETLNGIYLHNIRILPSLKAKFMEIHTKECIEREYYINKTDPIINEIRNIQPF